MKFMNSISLRMRIALLTGAMIIFVSLLLTYASMYNAGNRFYDLSAAFESKAVQLTPADTKDVSYRESQAAGEELEMTEIMPVMTIKMARKFNYWSYITMLLVAAAGMAASWFLAGRALEPVRKLSEAVKGIEAGSLKYRIAPGTTKDEIGGLSDAFNNMLDRLEESFERQKRFSSNVAHELKTPLATLKMSMQIGGMERDNAAAAAGGPVSGDVFSVAERSVDRLIHVVDDLMSLANEGILEAETIDLIPMLRGATEELLAAYREKDIKVNYEFHCERCLVSGDPGLLHRIFYNLIENGMKYNRRGGEVRIITGVTEGAKLDGGCLNIIVGDDGPGIEETQLSRIFEPFYCVDPSRSRKLGGAGLGLSIVKAAAERHGFAVKAESRVGEGAMFTVAIPTALILKSDEGESLE